MRRTFLTSESVTEGHPDKVADRISDAVLDAVLAADPTGRVACEVMVTGNTVVVAGEISSTAQLDIDAIAREAVRAVGYDDPALGFAADDVEVVVLVKRQSPDISIGVDTSVEARAGSADPLDALGAGDQGLMFGYAVNETDQAMPMPIQLAHRLAEQLASVRKDRTLEYLRPDGKTQVTVEYHDDVPIRVARVLISAQHEPDIEGQVLAADLLQQVIKPVADPHLDTDTEILVNPTGRFEIGGPAADTGLTGRKIVVDTYGGAARHGGGAFSGKDPTKVDRSASYAARHVAKNVVAAGLARRCELQVSYAIGRARPFSISVDTFGGSEVAPEVLETLVSEFFDFRPAAIIENLGLRRPIYTDTSAYGHFGRSDRSFSWEEVGVANDLARAASTL